MHPFSCVQLLGAYQKEVFALSPNPSPTFKKSGVLWGLPLVAPGYVARVCLRRGLSFGVCGTRLISEYGQLPNSVSVGGELPGFSGHTVGDDYFGVIFRVHVPSLSLSVTLKFG